MTELKCSHCANFEPPRLRKLKEPCAFRKRVCKENGFCIPYEPDETVSTEQTRNQK